MSDMSQDKEKMTVILVGEACPKCAMLKEKHKDKIASGELRIVDVTTEEGFRLVKDLSVTALPEIIGITFEEEKLTVCRLDADLSVIGECMEIEKPKKDAVETDVPTPE